MRCADIVYRRAQQLLHQLGQNTDLISESDAKLFCKHSSSLAVIRGTKIADEYDNKQINTSLICKCVLKNQIPVERNYHKNVLCTYLLLWGSLILTRKYNRLTEIVWGAA